MKSATALSFALLLSSAVFAEPSPSLNSTRRCSPDCRSSQRRSPPQTTFDYVIRLRTVIRITRMRICRRA
jgi:hypothetical protein